jgi:CRP-like cAMP-binding protein
LSIQALERRTYPAGTPIITVGEAATNAFVVDSGTIEIWVQTGSGRRVLATVTTGGIFGEMALIDKSPRSANATAVTDAACFVVPDKTIAEKIEKADPLIRGIMRILVRNVRTSLETKPQPID